MLDRKELEKRIQGLLRQDASGIDSILMRSIVDQKRFDPSLYGDPASTLLHKAVKAGDIELVEFFTTTNNRDLNVKDKLGFTPLHVAILNGQTEIAKLLIEEGANINVQNDHGSTLLHSAIFKCQDEIAKLLIEKGTDINLKDVENGATPLHVAIYRGKKEIVKLLIKEGANIDLRNNNEKTPLEFANFLGDTEIAKLLIANRADIDAQDKDTEMLIGSGATLSDDHGSDVAGSGLSNEESAAELEYEGHDSEGHDSAQLYLYS
jgi:ankyrin repeat protein